MSAAPAVELLGREPECARVAAAIAADRPVLVSGEAGIGKTTLVRAAATMASRRLIEGSGFATLAAMPYLALRRVLGADPGGEPGAVAVRVEAVVGPDVLFIDDLQWVDRDAGDRDRASGVAHEALATATDLRARATLLRIAAEAAPPGHAAGLRVEAARAAWDLEDAGTVRDLLLPVDDGPDEVIGVRDGLLARALVEFGQAEQAQAVLDHGRTLELDPAGEGAYEIATETALLEANVHGNLVRAIAVLDPIGSRSGAGAAAGGAWLARRRALLALLRYLNGESADVAAIEGGYTAAMAAARPAVARAAVRNLHSILLITRGTCRGARPRRGPGPAARGHGHGRRRGVPPIREHPDPRLPRPCRRGRPGRGPAARGPAVRA